MFGLPGMDIARSHGLGGRGPHEDMQSEMDVDEARGLAVGDQAVLVEIEHGIEVRRLELPIEIAQALSEIGHRGHVEPPYVQAVTVDRLEQRHPAPGLQNSTELAKGRRLVRDVDQDRSSG